MCTLDKDLRGQFKGTATVHFEKAEDAKRAVTQFNEYLLEEKKMNVVYDELSKIMMRLKKRSVMNQSAQSDVRLK